MRRRSTFALALALITSAGLPLGATASDVSSTHAYIQANYALAKAGVARIGAVQAKVQALNASLAQRCPTVGKGAMQNETTQTVSGEVVAALWSIAYGANAGPIHTFVGAARHLHWSNSRTTRIATRYAKSLGEMASLPMPDLCKDVGAFAAGGFQMASASVVALVDHAESIELEAVPTRLLAPFARGSDRAVLAKTASLELKLEENEFALGQTDWIEVLETLALPQ